MMTAPHRLIGTPLFRPVSGRPPANAAAGFRPVVAGQYLRATGDADTLEYIFLDSAGRRPAEHRYDITISPRLIWQQLNGEPTTRPNPTTITNPPANASQGVIDTREVSRTDAGADRLEALQRLSRLEAATHREADGVSPREPATAGRSITDRASEGHAPRFEPAAFDPAAFRFLTDTRAEPPMNPGRLEALQQLARLATAANREAGGSQNADGRAEGTTPTGFGIPRESATADHSIINRASEGRTSRFEPAAFHPTDLRFRSDTRDEPRTPAGRLEALQRLVRLVSAAHPNADQPHRTAGRNPLAARLEERGGMLAAGAGIPRRFEPDAFDPITLNFRTPAASHSGTGETEQSEHPSWQAAFGNSVPRQSGEAAVSRIESHAATNATNRLFLTEQSQRVLARFAAEQATIGGLTDARVTAGARTTLARATGFGGVSNIVVLQPARLVPAACRTVAGPAGDSPESQQTTVIRGAVSAGEFGAGVIRQFVRTTDSGVPTADSVPTVVRTAGAAPVTPSPLPSPITITPSPVTQPSPGPAGLSPDLMRQLTEQVARSLEAQAHATRERMGGF